MNTLIRHLNSVLNHVIMLLTENTWKHTDIRESLILKDIILAHTINSKTSPRKVYRSQYKYSN